MNRSAKTLFLLSKLCFDTPDFSYRKFLVATQLILLIVMTSAPFAPIDEIFSATRIHQL
jgi:hypothetical protein